MRCEPQLPPDVDDDLSFSRNRATFGEKQNWGLWWSGLSRFLTLSRLLLHPNEGEKEFSFLLLSFLFKSRNPKTLLKSEGRSSSLLKTLISMGKTSTSSEPSTRADRKFEKKLEFYAKVRDTVASLGVQKAISKKKKVRSRKKKLKAYDLSSLSEFLPDLKAPRQPLPTEFKLTSKSRRNLVLKETNQLKTVLDHPAFQADPLAAIHQHLQSTQPVTVEKPEKKKSKGGKKKSKKKKHRTSSGPQSMES